MRIILIGPPGAGKGTQAHWISNKYSIPLISTGDMLRHEIANNSKIGLKVKPLLKKGQLISDTLMIDLVRQRIAQPDCQFGFLFDGFPRTLTQAQMLTTDNIHVHGVFEIAVPDDILIKRLSGRRIHLSSGRIYNVYYNPPKILNQDDITNELLTQRDDDFEETVKKRLVTYHQQTQPLLDYYKQRSESGDPDAPKFFSIMGHASIALVRRHINSYLKQLHNARMAT